MLLHMRVHAGRPMGLVFERVFRAAAAHVSETEQAEQAEQARSREASEVLSLYLLYEYTRTNTDN
jgi:hypothetical protein